MTSFRLRNLKAPSRSFSHSPKIGAKICLPNDHNLCSNWLKKVINFQLSGPHSFSGPLRRIEEDVEWAFKKIIFIKSGSEFFSHLSLIVYRYLNWKYWNRKEKSYLCISARNKNVRTTHWEALYLPFAKCPTQSQGNTGSPCLGSTSGPVGAVPRGQTT